jgi:hypothetical protein
MNPVPDMSRRRLLQMFGAAPLLPLSTFAGAGLLAGCGGSAGSADAGQCRGDGLTVRWAS